MFAWNAQVLYTIVYPDDCRDYFANGNGLAYCTPGWRRGRTTAARSGGGCTRPLRMGHRATAMPNAQAVRRMLLRVCATRVASSYVVLRIVFNACFGYRLSVSRGHNLLFLPIEFASAKLRRRPL